MKLGKVQHLVLYNDNIQVKIFMLQKFITYTLRTIENAQMNKIRYCFLNHIVSIWNGFYKLGLGTWEITWPRLGCITNSPQHME